MTLKIHPIPAFDDNYIWLLQRKGSQQVAVVDPGQAAPVLAVLNEQNLTLVTILITHHHADHIGGIRDLMAACPGVEIVGPDSEKISLPHRHVREGDCINVLGLSLNVLEIPGHTLDHIAYYLPACTEFPTGGVFCGDTLFAGGCGRIFEGNPSMMLNSLNKISALPQETAVFCAHEYTLANLKFALVADKGNTALERRMDATSALRHNGEPSVPSTIEIELRTNPFLRCHTHAVAESVAAHTAVPVQGTLATFTHLRAWKDHF